MRSTQHRADTEQLRDEGFRPYRDLAVRVLARAFQDLTSPVRSSDRESARVFLAGSGMMQYWCRVASLDPFCVVNHAEKLTAKQKSRWPTAQACAVVAGDDRGLHVRLVDDKGMDDP